MRGVVLSCTHDKLNVWNIGLHVDSVSDAT